MDYNRLTYLKCVDSNGTAVGHEWNQQDQHNIYCTGIYDNYTWNPAATNFDNVLEGFWSLSQVVTFNGWLGTIQSAEDSRWMYFQPSFEMNPTMFLYFVGFVIFGVLYPLNILFGLLLSYFRTEGLHRILSTPAQFKYIQASKGGNSEEVVTPIPNNGCSQKVYGLMDNPWFMLGICGIILLDTVIVALDSTTIPHEIYYAMNLLIGLVYTVEMILKLIAWRHYYFTKWWNILDFAVVILSLVGSVMLEFFEQSFSPGIMRIFRLIHLLRLRSIFTIELNTLKNFRRALEICFPILLNILLFYGTIYFSYAVLGMTLFRNNSLKPEFRSYFQDFESSVMSLFLMVTLSGWEGIYELGIRKQQGECIPFKNCDHTALGLVYVFSFMTITFLVAVNLYLTLGLEIIDQLNKGRERDTDKNESENEVSPVNHDDGPRLRSTDQEGFTASDVWNDGFEVTT